MKSKTGSSKTDKAESTSTLRMPSKDGVRETIESVAIAFVLAFLFRTFEAEAFVIPTGSMAPTLMGAHKDINCSECGFPFRVGASKENPDEGNAVPVVGATCPNCRFEMRWGHKADEAPPTYKGDRIIVAKFPYEISDPRRWDVAVFKYPGSAKTNFIKRLVGLPRETVRIYHGDIFSKPEGGTQYQIERKPPDKVLAMLQAVYDNDYTSTRDDIIKKGWPARWRPTATKVPGTWQPNENYQSYSTSGPIYSTTGEAAETELRYSHFVPTHRDWRLLENGPLSQSQIAALVPQLITDFYGYDTDITNMLEAHGLNWVGDLALECELKVDGNTGEAIFELIEGGRAFRCGIDLATGKARLTAEDLPKFGPQATTVVKGPGTYKIRFANVDDQLLLWVNGSLVQFEQPTGYTLPFQGATMRDRSPVAVIARGAKLEVAHLRILRDIYYVATRLADPKSENAFSNDEYARRGMKDYNGSNAFIENPNDPFPQLEHVDMELQADQFLALGDNSPCSKDSRLWDQTEYWVSRDLLIGKALFVYWPHALDRIPGTSIPFPMFPNFARMKFIR